MRRITISLSDEPHEELRREAFRAGLSIADVIGLRIQIPTEATAKAQTRRKGISDPLLKVAGICGGAVISANIDDELYH